MSLRAAIAIRNRLIDRYGACAASTQSRSRPATWSPAARRTTSSRSASRTGRREYVVTLARSEVDLGALAGLPDEEVHARLRALPGIGEWTVDWFLARHLARPRAWPAGDLALRKAASRFYGAGRR